MRRSIGSGDSNIYNQIKLSEVLMRQDDKNSWREAVEILVKTLKIAPTCVEAMVVLGRTFERMENLTAAKEVYQKAVS